MMQQYLLNILIGLDQLVTTLVGGYPDETLSSYAYRLWTRKKLGGIVFKPLIDFLFSWQKLPGGHCLAAYNEERVRAQLPPIFRS